MSLLGPLGIRKSAFEEFGRSTHKTHVFMDLLFFWLPEKIQNGPPLTDELEEIIEKKVYNLMIRTIDWELIVAEDVAIMEACRLGSECQILIGLKVQEREFDKDGQEITYPWRLFKYCYCFEMPGWDALPDEPTPSNSACASASVTHAEATCSKREEEKSPNALSEELIVAFREIKF